MAVIKYWCGAEARLDQRKLSVEVFGSGFRSLVSSHELEISSNLETKCDQVGRQAVCREALWSDW